MAYDERLLARIRKAVSGRDDVVERRMFGGVAFLLDGKMFCGITQYELMLRVGPARYDDALTRRHVRPMDFTGRPMRGYVFVASAGCRTEAAVAAWVEEGIAFVTTLAGVPRRSPRRGARQGRRVPTSR